MQQPASQWLCVPAGVEWVVAAKLLPQRLRVARWLVLPNCALMLGLKPYPVSHESQES